MEEILASIRRIVFDAGDGAAASGAGASEAGRSRPRAGRPAGGETAAAKAPEPTETVAPAAEPPQAGTRVSGGTPGAARAVPPAPPEAPAPDRRVPEFADRPAVEATGDTDSSGPAPDAAIVPDAEIGPETDAAPGDDVLLLTDMIAPDGSVVRLDPRPGEAGLEPAEKGELAAAVREWLDRNAPDMIDRAARRELQKLAERRE